ncbi:MAG: hypothetical protein RLP15_01835 [Cryomorphaceae bacterium]
MKTNILSWISFAMILTLLATSCSTSNDVVSTNIIQKRKHRSGYHLNLGSQKSVANVDRKSAAASKENHRSSPRAAEQPSDATRFGANASEMHASKLSRRAIISTAKASLRDGSLVPQGLKRRSTKKHLQEEETGPLSAESAFPAEEDEDDSSNPESAIALIAGILAWVFAGVGIVVNFVLPPFGVLFSIGALALAIIAVVYGSRTKNEETIGMLGFVLGLVYLILVALALLLLTLIFILFIIAFSA